jgi:hypothetical protein
MSQRHRHWERKPTSDLDVMQAQRGWVLNAPGPVEEIALHGYRLVVEGKKVIARTAEGSCPDQRFRKGLLKSLSSHAAAPRGPLARRTATACSGCPRVPLIRPRQR